MDANRPYELGWWTVDSKDEDMVMARLHIIIRCPECKRVAGVNPGDEDRKVVCKNCGAPRYLPMPIIVRWSESDE